MSLFSKAEAFNVEAHSNITAYHHEGERYPSSIKYIVVHVAECPNDAALGVANYFHRPESGGSANMVVDTNTAYRTLGDNIIPVAGPPLNTLGWHIEHCGYAAWTREQWLKPKNVRTLKRGAYKAALRCHWYKIPYTVLGPQSLEHDFGTDIQGGVPYQAGSLRGGIVEHRTINQVYHQSDHSCPGPGFPIDVWSGFLRGFLKAWGVKTV